MLRKNTLVGAPVHIMYYFVSKLPFTLPVPATPAVGFRLHEDLVSSASLTGGCEDSCPAR